MTQLVYDGTFEGLLTAVFECYERKLADVTLSRPQTFQPMLQNDWITVVSDARKADRLWEGLKKKISTTALNDVYKTFLSELPTRESIILTFVRHAFAHHDTIEKDYGSSSVLSVSQISKKVHREKHRMEAFVRFQRTQDDIYWAVIEPDFDVLPLLIHHFQDRYASQHWIIYDRRRKYGLHHDADSHTVATITAEFSPEMEREFLPAAVCHEEELAYQALWKKYFQRVNIASRKNDKLHVRHVPTRYWKYLTEKR